MSLGGTGYDRPRARLPMAKDTVGSSVPKVVIERVRAGHPGSDSRSTDCPLKVGGP